MRLKDLKVVFTPKYKCLINKGKYSLMQNTWFNILPYIVIFGYGGDDNKPTYEKLSAISIGWLYWEFTWQISYEENNN